MAKKKEQNINHWMRTFGKPEGHKVLREIIGFAEELDYLLNPKITGMAQGRKQMLNFIKDRLKASARNKETYAGIIYETELL